MAARCASEAQAAASASAASSSSDSIEAQAPPDVAVSASATTGQSSPVHSTAAGVGLDCCEGSREREVSRADGQRTFWDQNVGVSAVFRVSLFGGSLCFVFHFLAGSGVSCFTFPRTHVFHVFRVSAGRVVKHRRGLKSPPDPPLM